LLEALVRCGAARSTVARAAARFAPLALGEAPPRAAGNGDGGSAVVVVRRGRSWGEHLEEISELAVGGGGGGAGHGDGFRSIDVDAVLSTISRAIAAASTAAPDNGENDRDAQSPPQPQPAKIQSERAASCVLSLPDRLARAETSSGARAAALTAVERVYYKVVCPVKEANDTLGGRLSAVVHSARVRLKHSDGSGDDARVAAETLAMMLLDIYNTTRVGVRSLIHAADVAADALREIECSLAV
jgi:hypothetical protein